MQEITVDELKARLDQGARVHLLDVREPEEFEAFHLEGCRLLPLGRVMSMDTEEIESWKEEEVVVYCRSGKRSLQAGLMLETLGFADVKNLTGGVLAWQERFGG